MEVWRIIGEFPDYEASDYGRIRRAIPNCRGDVGAIIKQRIGRYANVTLYRNGKPVVVSVHRIICTTFHGTPPSPKHHAAHCDGDRSNNLSSNLRWATAAENEADKIDHGTSLAGRKSSVPVEHRARGETHGRHTKPESTARGERNCHAKLTEAKVSEIRIDGRPRKQISESYGISVTMVGYIQRGISWAHVSMPQITGELT